MVCPRRPRRCRDSRANYRSRGQLPEGRTRAPNPSSVTERHLSELQFTRRQTVAALAASAAMPLIAKATPAFAQARQRLTEAQVSAVLQSFAENLLQLSPEQATSLGIDKGARAPLRTRLSDKSTGGQARVRQTIAADLKRAE